MPETRGETGWTQFTFLCRRYMGQMDRWCNERRKGGWGDTAARRRGIADEPRRRTQVQATETEPRESPEYVQTPPNENETASGSESPGDKRDVGRDIWGAVGYAVASSKHKMRCNVHIVNTTANNGGMGENSRAKPTTYTDPKYPLCHMKGRSVLRRKRGEREVRGTSRQYGEQT